MVSARRQDGSYVTRNAYHFKRFPNAPPVSIDTEHASDPEEEEENDNPPDVPNLDVPIPRRPRNGRPPRPQQNPNHRDNVARPKRTISHPKKLIEEKE